MPQDNSDHYDVLIGVVAGAHGLAGEVRVVPASDFPERFARLATVFLEQASRGQLMTVSESRLHSGKGQVILKLAGIEDRNAAAALRGAQLLVPMSQALPLAEGQYYEFQVVGLEVVTTSGESLGPITEVLRTGANDVYVTERALIPAIDSVVKQIDLQQGRMVIEPPSGLLD